VVKQSDLPQRLISAAVLAPLVLGLVWLGGAGFFVLVVAVALLSIREWVRMVALGSGWAPLILSYIAVGAVLAADLLGGALPALGVLAVLPLATFVVVPPHAKHNRSVIAFGIPYIAGSCVAMIWLRADPQTGFSLFLYFLLTVWATDTGAYVVGRWWGGPRLAPAISPSKTWAGLIGGMIAAGCTGLAVALVAEAQQPWFAALLSVGLAVAAQCGDLFESAVKRRYKLKDSGGLIPGHGGLLDRIDGLIAVAPVLAVFQATVGVSFSWW